MIKAAAYWAPELGPRGDDAVAAFVAMWDLAERTIGARTWHPIGERATHTVTREDVPSLLDAGVVHSDDSPPQVMTQLGRSVDLWDSEDGDDDGGRLSASVEGTGVRARGSAILEHPDLPATAEEAWPLLQEMIRIWGPQTASWTTSKVRKFGIRAGLSVAQPHFGLLTWVRDGTESPFVGGDTLRTNGGTLYRFGDDLADLTSETAAQVIRSS